MRRNALQAHGFRVILEQLPNDLLAQRLAAHVVSAIHRSEKPAGNNTCLAYPTIDRDLDPCRHWNRPNTPVLPDKVYNAPTTIPLLDVGHFQCCNLGASEPATEEQRQNRAISQSLFREGARRVEQRLRLS